MLGIGCRCGNGWRVVQDVGYYHRNDGSTHGETSGSSRENDNGLKCEVHILLKIVDATILHTIITCRYRVLYKLYAGVHIYRSL